MNKKPTPYPGADFYTAEYEHPFGFEEFEMFWTTGRMTQIAQNFPDARIWANTNERFDCELAEWDGEKWGEVQD
jgi:hypothetical protein